MPLSSACQLQDAALIILRSKRFQVCQACPGPRNVAQILYFLLLPNLPLFNRSFPGSWDPLGPATLILSSLILVIASSRALAVCYDLLRLCYSGILSQEEALLTDSLAWRTADTVFQQILAKSLVRSAGLSRKRAYKDVYGPKKLNPPLGYPLESVGEIQRSQAHQWCAENNCL